MKKKVIPNENGFVKTILYKLLKNYGLTKLRMNN